MVDPNTGFRCTWQPSAGVATHLIWLGQPLNTTINACASFTVAALDTNNALAPVSTERKIQLSSTSTTGAFYTDNQCKSLITSSPLVAGTHQIALYYSDSVAGAATITATDASSEGVGKASSAVNAVDSTTCVGLSGGSWVPIPGDTNYGTSSFCVMKYSAGGGPLARPGLVPLNTISQSDSIAQCASLGSHYHLMTNPEWMTIAANIASIGKNWSSGTVGSGTLSTGNSDGVSSSTCASDSNDANAWLSGDCCCRSPETEGFWFGLQ